MPQYALAILLGALIAFYGNQALDIFWATYLPLLLIAARFCPRYRFLCLLAASLLWCQLLLQTNLSYRLHADFDNQTLLVAGDIADLPRIGAERSQLLLENLEIDAYPGTMPRRIRLSWYRSEQRPAAGERWQFTARLRQPRASLNSAGFDYETWLFVEGIDGVGYVVDSAHNRRLETASRFALDHLRGRLAAGIDRDCPDCAQAGLIKALALGYRGAIDRATRQTLQTTGTAHLLAISGLHIGMVAALFFAVGHFAWRGGGYRLPLSRRDMAALSAFAAALGYAALAGFSLPTLRALIMLTVVLLGQQFHHRIDLLHSALLALVLILVVDPLAVGSASFWLSFGALLVIAFMRFRVPQPLSRWRQLFVLQCFFVFLFTPPGILIFDQFNVASLPANLVAIPALGFVILPLVLCACLLSVFGAGIAAGLFWLADRLLGYLIEYLDALAGIGLESQFVAFYPVLFLLLALAAMLLCLLPGVPGRFVLLLALLVCLPGWPPSRLASGEFELRVFDVGMGSSALLRTRHHSLVFDVGPGREEGYSAAEQALLPVMRKLRIDAADLLVVSHVDQDHSGGLHAMLDQYRPERLLSGTPRELRRRFGLAHRVRSCHAYPAWRWDGVDFRFLAVTSVGRSTNNRSCILQVNGHHRLLLPGDIEAIQEKKLLQAHAGALTADILLAPHHGSGSSSSRAFVDRVNPAHVVFTVGRNNRWGFPADAVVERYRARGAMLYRSDADGEIRFVSRAAGLHVDTRRNPPRRLWRRW